MRRHPRESVAKAGVQDRRSISAPWIPACAGMTDGCGRHGIFGQALKAEMGSARRRVPAQQIVGP
jgi:hypothetical protein